MTRFSFLAAIALALCSGGCGPTFATDARRGLITEKECERTAYETLLDLDKAKTDEIWNAQISADEKERQINTYLALYAPARDALRALTHASRAVETAIDLYEAGKGGQVDVLAAASTLLSAALALRDAGALLKFKVPGLDVLISNVQAFTGSKSSTRELRLALAEVRS